MCKIVCITNRKLCKGSFFVQLENIARCRPELIILREKDLSESEYLKLAAEAKVICERHDVRLCVNSYWRTALQLGIKQVHLPLHLLREMSDEDKRKFALIGASCHSAEDVREAEQLGADYIIAGHIFETDCKKGLAGRGTGFLADICRISSVPVYAIGGINDKNAKECTAAGADGVCLMSSLMQAENVSEYMDSIRGEMNE